MLLVFIRFLLFFQSVNTYLHMFFKENILNVLDKIRQAGPITTITSLEEYKMLPEKCFRNKLIWMENVWACKRIVIFAACLSVYVN